MAESVRPPIYIPPYRHHLTSPPVFPVRKEPIIAPIMERGLYLPATTKLYNEADYPPTRALETQHRWNSHMTDETGKRYEGGWFYQLDEDTCLPWAIAHAAMVIGSSVDHKFLHDMVTYARDETKAGGPGSRMHELMSLQSARQPREWQCIRTGFAQFGALISTSGQQEQFEPDEVYRTNAYTISTALAGPTGGCIIVSAEAQRMYNDPSACWNHSLCVSGYRVSNGAFDVQIIDSGDGIYWTSLEHLSYALNPRNEHFYIHLKGVKTE